MPSPNETVRLVKELLNGGNALGSMPMLFLPSGQTIAMDDGEVALSVDGSETQLTSNILYVDPESTDSTPEEDLLLPPEADSEGLFLLIANTADSSEDVVVKDDGDSDTIATISQNEVAVVFCDGAAWRGGVMATT